MLKTLILALTSSWFVGNAALALTSVGESGSQLFQFKFDRSEPLIYAVDFETRTVEDNLAENRRSGTIKSIDLRFKFKLTPVSTNADGTMVVYYHPFDLEEANEITGQNKKTVISINGMTIVSKQNGVVMIDTEKKIGMPQAQTLKQAVYPLLFSGYFDIEPTGHIKRVRGDLPFTDYWQNKTKSQMDPFYISFPTNDVAVQDSWTNFYTIKSSGGMTLNGSGVVQPWTYIREFNQATTNGEISSFSLAESDNGSDLDAYLDQMGQQTSVAIPKHAESMNATFQFDQKVGRMVGVKYKSYMRDEVSMMVQGNSLTGNSESRTDISIALVSP